jgi:hypothetical protein
MAPLVTPYYTAHYQAAPPLVRGVVLRPMSAAEFTEACEMLLAQAQHHGCPFWLLDGCADDFTRPLDVYEWLTDEFLPRVRQALGRVPCLAFIARPEFWQALQARNYAASNAGQVSAVFRANWFTTEADALAWLQQFRPVLGEAQP